MKRTRDLTEGSILKGFVLFALPLFFGSLFQQLYGTVDLMYVGKFLGTTASAAVGASGTLVTCLIGLFTGISVGAGVVTAGFWGARKEDEVKSCIQNALVMGFAGGIVLTVVGIGISKPALQLLNTPDTILEEALVYIRIYFLSTLPMIIYNMCAGILRAIGDSRTPFLVLAAGGILNVVMDGLLILVIPLGVAGAAVATLASQTFTAVVLFVHIYRLEGLGREHWNIDLARIGHITAVGLPLGIQSMILTLSNLIVQYHINGFGETSVAAFAVYFKAESFIYLPILAFGQAMVTFVGQNRGARKMDRIRRGAVSCNVLSAAVTAVIASLVLTLDRQVLGLFSNEEAVIETCRQIIWVSFPFYFLYAIQEVAGGVIRGLGKTVQSMCIVMLTLCGARVLILSFFVHRFGTVSAVAAVYPITWAAAAVLFICTGIFFLREKKPDTV